MTAVWLKIVLSSAVAIGAGLPLVAPHRKPAAGDLALAWTVALGNASVLALVAGLCGLDLSPLTMLLLLIAPGALTAALARPEPRRGDGAGEPPAAHPALVLASRIALACALAVFVFKLVQMPLWGWDHFAVWGVKARRMLEDGHLRLGFLSSLYQTRTDHPLGVPMAWLLLTLGETPSPAVFRVLHALFAVALIAVLQGAARLVCSSSELANAAAAALAMTPLFWDTEVVGLAELPLALWALATVLLLLRAGERRWVPGLALGFLPWVKQEGLVLGLLLLLSAPFLGLRHTRRGAMGRGVLLCGPALVLMAGALAIQRYVLPPGVSFFVGDWWRRGLDRLPLTVEIQRQCAADLLQPGWLGFWMLLGALTGVAAARKQAAALALVAVVWSQVLVYELTAFFSYIPPADHLRAAFLRICGPLVPIGIVGMTLLFRNDRRRSTEVHLP